MYFCRCNGKVDENVGLILISGKLLCKRGFTNSSCSLYENCGFSVPLPLPFEQSVVHLTLEQYSIFLHSR